MCHYRLIYLVQTRVCRGNCAMFKNNSCDFTFSFMSRASLNLGGNKLV